MYKRFIYTLLEVPQLAFATDVFLFCLRCGWTDKLLTAETFGIPRMISFAVNSESCQSIADVYVK